MNRLRELRAGRYTQAEMAELLGVGRTTYTKYERGDIRLSAEVLEKLAQVFDLRRRTTRSCGTCGRRCAAIRSAGSCFRWPGARPSRRCARRWRSSTR